MSRKAILILVGGGIAAFAILTAVVVLLAVAVDRSDSDGDADDGSSTITYTNTELGIAFDYPVGWFIEEAEQITLFSFDRTTVGDVDNFLLTNPDALIFEVLFGLPGGVTPPAEQAATCRSVGACIGNRDVLSETSFTMPSDITGIRWQVSADLINGALGPSIQTFIVINDRNFGIRGFGSFSRFDAIFNTLRTI